MENLQDDRPNPLRQQLSPEQIRLLELMWESISAANELGIAPGWPIWDYVSRRLYQDFPDVASAADVFFSLPVIPHAHLDSGKSYGLVWRDNPTFVNDLHPADRMGLTIAGLAALQASKPTMFNYAGAVLDAIVTVAKSEEDLVPDPNSVQSTTVVLTELIDWLATPDDRRPFSPSPDSRLIAFPAQAVLDTIRYEFPRLSLYDSQVTLSGNFLRSLAAVATVDEYLDLALRQGFSRGTAPARTSPLTLIQTIDHLSYVIVDLQIWKGRTRIVNAPDLESAASLTAEVRTREEFETALLGLYNVIAKLRVEPIPDGTPGDRKGTINAMQYWFTAHLADDTEAIARVVEALNAVRSVVNLRHVRAHSNPETRARAIKDQTRLGLPAVIADWPEAWEIVRARLANEFDAIRRELQAASGAQA